MPPPRAVRGGPIEVLISPGFVPYSQRPNGTATGGVAKKLVEARYTAAVAQTVGATSWIAADAPDAELEMPDGRRVGLEVVTADGEGLRYAQSYFERFLQPLIGQRLGNGQSVHLEVDVDEFCSARGEQATRMKKLLRLLPEYVACAREMGYQFFTRDQLRDYGIDCLRSMHLFGGGVSYRYVEGAFSESAVARALRVKASKVAGYRVLRPHLSEMWLAVGPADMWWWNNQEGRWAEVIGMAFTRAFAITELFPIADSAVAREVLLRRGDSR